MHCVNPAQAAKVRFCLFCLVFWKRFKFKFPLIFESDNKYSDNLVVIISLICQQVTYRLADTL